ncbi:hypothetical protein BHM03_00061545, partial [Ensete ventricosum]
QGGYYLTALSGFRVGGAPSNNKGWRAQFLFVSRHRGWDFGIEWSAHRISNVPPNLSDEETNVVEQLKGILSASRAIRNLTEEWLVEAGLSPASCDSVGQKKKDQRKSPHKADRASRGKGLANTSDEPPAPRQRPKSVRELCSARAGVDGRDYHAIRMCNLPEQASDAPLDPDLRPLTHGTPVWQSGEASTTYIRGVLLPRLASDLYTLPSEVLMDGAAKAMVLNQHYQATLFDRVHEAGWVITSLDDKVTLLRQELQDLKEGENPDAVAAAEVRATEAQSLAEV